MTRRFWTREEDELLRSIYPSLLTPEVARVLNRSVNAVYDRAELLGVEKSAAYIAEKKRAEAERLTKSGKAHRFQKGLVPHNKGTRRPGWAVGRMRETQFKKGQPPRNTLPLWSFRMVDGYLMLKTGKPHKPPCSGWEYVHRLIWEHWNGPLPNWREARIWWKDGDHLNNSLSNLELLNGADHAARTTVHNLPPELVQVIQLRGAINRAITMRGRNGE
jgi:hypothetical protein